MLLTVILFVTIVTYFAITYVWRRMKKWNTTSPPRFPGWLPVIGHAHRFAGDTLHLWNMMKESDEKSFENGDGIITINLGTWTIYFITDPEISYQILTTCLDKDAVYDMSKPWLGDGLVSAPVHTWKRHRKLLNPAFSQHVLNGYLTVFNEQSRKLADALAKEAGKGYFDHSSYLEKTTLETICLTAMGIEDTELLRQAHYMEAVDGIFHTLVKRVQSTWMQNEFLFKFTALKKKQDSLVRILHKVSNEVIQKRKSTLLENYKSGSNVENVPRRYKSYLDLLLESSADGSLTDTEIREEVDTMISAGYDTSASLLTFALVLIGSNPEVQEKVYEELQEVFKGTDRDVDKHDLPKLVYLEAVVKEVLRLYPVVPLVARYLNRDVQLRNYTLAAGSSCFFSIRGIHTHPVWGLDRLSFRPERWLSAGEVPDKSLFAAFNVGKRTCIGQKFAYMSTKTTLSHILRRYTIQADHTKMQLKMEIMLKPHSGHHIKISKRPGNDVIESFNMNGWEVTGTAK